LANSLIIEKLNEKGIDVEAGNGERGLLAKLFEYDHRFIDAGQTKELSEAKLANVFSPKVNWEPLLVELIPDVWKTEWAQELYRGKKFEAAILGPGKRQIPSAIMSLKVADLVFCSLRSICNNQDADWPSNIRGISKALPADILRAIKDNNNPLNADVDSKSCYSIDGVKQKWIKVVGNELKLNSHQYEIMREVTESLYAGKCPGFRLHAKDYTYIVLRIRYASGQWLLDCVNTGERQGEQPNGRIAGTPRAWPLIDMPDSADVFVKELRSISIASQAYERPKGMHLGFTRAEDYWLDYHPIIELEIKRKFKVVGEPLRLKDDNQGDENVPIPLGWMSMKIIPRFGKCSWDDPAWLEFVQTLVGWAGRIRLRAPGTEAEKDPMLSFCTSAFVVTGSGSTTWQRCQA